MANKQHLSILNNGVKAWNEWVRVNDEIQPDLRDADLSGLDLSKINFKEARLKGANLAKANLQGAKLDNAYMRRADLSGANLTGASLSGANLRHAVLRGATLTRAYLRRVDLSYVDLSGADLSESVLEYARLVDTNLDNATLKNCFIYGASVWNLLGEPKEQSDLVITPEVIRRNPGTGSKRRVVDEPIIKVDDIEVAQIIYLLLNHEKLRNTINAVTQRGVLLLGRFGGGGLDTLRSIAARLRTMGYLPIIFDFEKPDDRDLTETVSTLAHLSRFIIADITDPSSVPLELQAIAPNLTVPVQAIILKSSQPEFAMFQDLRRKYHWVLKTCPYDGIKDLLESLEEKVVAPAEAKIKELSGK